MKMVERVKKVNSISQARLNFQRRPILCTTLYGNPIQARNFGVAFHQYFCTIFTEDASLTLLYLGAKSQKGPKTQIKGSCLVPIFLLFKLGQERNERMGMKRRKIISLHCCSFSSPLSFGIS